MAKKNVSDFENEGGKFLGLVCGIMNIVREMDAPFAVIDRLLKPEGAATIRKMVGVAIEDYNASITPAKAEPPPRTSRLTQTFEVEVDCDDLENLVIPQVGGEVYYVDEAIKPKHFPIRGKGKVVKKMRYLEFDYEPTTEEILDATKEHGAHNPDIADTRAFHKKNPGERDIGPVLSFCGEFVGRGDDRFVASVGADGYGLFFFHLQFQWYPHIRVLVLSE